MKNTVIILILILITTACTPRLHEVKKTEDIMGTFVTITVYDENKDIAEIAVEQAFNGIKQIDSLLSNYKPDSQVSILNREKTIANPSEELKENIEKSIYYGKLSGGAFDITVQPILDLYTKSFTIENRTPTKEEIENELKKVDYKRIEISKNQISIGKDQEITLGGIAKGYAVDEAIKTLQEFGIKNALVNAGGDMMGIGKKYNSIPWTIALANPRNTDEFITTIQLKNNAVVTSGDYERYFNENKSFHHIVDPKTGYSATELISVTIIADNAFDADALSTTVFVLGKDKGLNLIEQLNNTEGLIITADKEIIKSSGFPSSVS